MAVDRSSRGGVRAPALLTDRMEAVYAWLPSPSAQTLWLPEQIAERVGNAIIHGLYEPGTRVQEQEIADHSSRSAAARCAGRPGHPPGTGRGE